MSVCVVTVCSVSGQYLGIVLMGEADAASPRLARVYTEEVESVCLLVCQTLLPGVLRCVTERWREMEAGLAEGEQTVSL